MSFRPSTHAALAPLGDRLTALRTGEPGVRTLLTGSFRAAPGVAESAPVLTFVASDESMDRHGDIVRQGGLRLENFRRNPVVPDCHDYSSIAKILGTCDSVAVQGGKLVNSVRFALENPLGSLAYKLAKSGHLRAQSIGFLPLKYAPLANSHDGYEFQESELLEISLVVVPANANAVAQLKSALQSGAIERSDLGAAADVLRSISGLAQLKDCPAPNAFERLAQHLASAAAPGPFERLAELLAKSSRR
jgi:HK97 family phage prohead protease